MPYLYMNGSGTAMKNIDKVELRKMSQKYMRQAQSETKSDHCLLCGKLVTSFCNSHSVPRFALKSIAENGEVVLASKLMGNEISENKSGVNKSGTFHLICGNCDNSFFQDYESQEKLAVGITDKLLAEIAVKNFLLQLNKRYTERHLYKILQRELHMFENVEELYDTVELDIKDYFDDMEFHKNIALNGIEGGYQVIHYELLPYRIPIAFQSAIALDKDMKGYQVNDLHDFSPETRIQYLHLAVFPMKDTSVVIAFYHKRDKKYQRLRHQFKSINKETKLMYLNYLIFAYSENYFISKKILNTLETDEALKKLSREINGIPNLGQVNLLDIQNWNYAPVSMNDIPNFLSREWAI